MTPLQTAQSLAKTVIYLSTANEMKGHMRGKPDTEIQAAIALLNKNKFLYKPNEKILYKL